ncbi:hypothetical protein Naga_101598g1, partial [Nannochloropsis gaditana]
MDTVCKRSAACRCPDCAAASAAFSIDDLRALAPSRSVYDDDDNGDTSNPPPPSRPVCASPSGAAPPPVPGRHPRRHQGADPVKTEGEAVAVPYPTRKGPMRRSSSEPEDPIPVPPPASSPAPGSESRQGQPSPPSKLITHTTGPPASTTGMPTAPNEYAELLPSS